MFPSLPSTLLCFMEFCQCGVLAFYEQAQIPQLPMLGYLCCCFVNLYRGGCVGLLLQISKESWVGIVCKLEQEEVPNPRFSGDMFCSGHEPFMVLWQF